MVTSNDASDSEAWLEGLEGPLREYAEEQAAFIESFRNKLARTNLWVVVLGPGEDGTGYEKRCEIRDTLNNMQGVRAYFPEDEEYKRYIERRYGLSSQSIIEITIVQCASAHVVLALETTEGPREEVAMFSRRDDIWPHLFPLVHEKYKGKAHDTLPGHVRNRLQVRHYSDTEMSECHVATQICPEIVRARQIQRSDLLTDLS